jgi:UPF0755 protein
MTEQRKRRTPCLMIFIVLVLGLFFLAILAAAAVASGIPDQAQTVFGPPAVHLSSLQKLGYSTLLLAQQKDLTEPVDPTGIELPFRIEPGESVPSITGRLYRDRLIDNPGAFRTYLLYSGLDRSIQAGTYRLSPAMSPLEIAGALQDATPASVTFTILAGWRLEEIAASLPTSGLQFSGEAFLAAARNRPVGFTFSELLPESASLEGFLLPGEYTFDREVSLDEFLAALLDNFEETVSEDLRRGYQNQGLNLYEAVTLASIVQKEAVVESDMPLIASVFYNRLNINMKLDTDPTVQYAVGYNDEQRTWWTNPLSLADLRIDSPYNTYIYPGLPPGPIASPNLAALRATAYPAKTPYYYFRAGCQADGRHLFAETYQEHINNACP